MSSQSFLPLSSTPESPILRPRRPSLDPERDILSTRGQRLLNLFPSRTSAFGPDLDDEHSERRVFLRRGSLLIGHSNPRYEWYQWPDDAMVSSLNSNRRVGNVTTNPPRF